jgi:hypothetical protein
VDPDGASRTLGHNQVDAMQGHEHDIDYDGFDTSVPGALNSFTRLSGFSIDNTDGIVTDGVNGTPRITTESRMVNFSTKFVIWY